MAAAPKHGSRPGHTALTGLLVTRWGGAGDRCCGCYWLRDNSGGSPHWPGHHLQLQRKHQDGHQQASALHCTPSKGSHSGVSCPVFFTISHFEAFSLPVQDSVQFYLPHTQQSVDGRISSEPAWSAWLVTVKDEKCLVYCECKQCEMGNPAYLWNAVLCRHENIPRLARVTGGDGEEILAAAWTQARTTTIRWTATLTLQWTLRGFSRRRPPIEPSPSSSTFNLRHY